MTILALDDFGGIGAHSDSGGNTPTWWECPTWCRFRGVWNHKPDELADGSGFTIDHEEILAFTSNLDVRRLLTETLTAHGVRRKLDIKAFAEESFPLTAADAATLAAMFEALTRRLEAEAGGRR